MGLTERLIGIVPLGDVAQIALKVIAAHISGYFKLHAQILTPLEPPVYAFDDGRLQYDAGIIINRFESMAFPQYDKVIGILNLDLFVPIFTYVFGEARQNGKFALVSLFRLSRNPDGSIPPSSIIYERAAKVALHELGHLFNLLHCEDKRCIMCFSGSIDDLDELPFHLCRYCTEYFKDVRGH